MRGVCCSYVFSTILLKIIIFIRSLFILLLFDWYIGDLRKENDKMSIRTVRLPKSTAIRASGAYTSGVFHCSKVHFGTLRPAGAQIVVNIPEQY